MRHSSLPSKVRWNRPPTRVPRSEDPEVFIATAELFCDLLREGMTTEELLAEYLDRLSDGGVVEVDEDDGLMAGVLLGASMEIVCPDYSEEST